MEMGRSSAVFAIIWVAPALVNAGLPCNNKSDCDRSLQFCDKLIGRCRSCGSLPCAESTMKEQGDGWCRKICPEYWENHLNTADTTTTTLASSPGQHGDAEKIVQNFETGKDDPDEGNTVSNQNNVPYILLGVLGSALVVSGVVGIIIYAKRLDRMRKPKEEENRDHADEPMVGPQPFRQHGPIEQDQGGV